MHITFGQLYNPILVAYPSLNMDTFHRRLIFSYLVRIFALTIIGSSYEMSLTMKGKSE